MLQMHYISSNYKQKEIFGTIAGQSFDYSFDQIGNRQMAHQGTTGNDTLWSYTANAVNQYSLITEPNGV